MWNLNATFPTSCLCWARAYLKSRGLQPLKFGGNLTKPTQVGGMDSLPCQTIFVLSLTNRTEKSCNTYSQPHLLDRPLVPGPLRAVSSLD